MIKQREIIINQKLIDRFFNKINKTETCWIWTAAQSSGGYGHFGGGASYAVRAHRVSWTIKNAPIPPGLVVRHKCDSRLCVNPDHLTIGTQQENMNDLALKKRNRHFKNHEFYGVIKENRKYEGDNRKERWRSFVCIERKIIKLGAHNSVLEAAKNYDRIAYITFGVRDKLNFPEDYKIERWLSKRKPHPHYL